MNKIILLFSLALLLSGCNRARQEQGREDDDVTIDLPQLKAQGEITALAVIHRIKVQRELRFQGSPLCNQVLLITFQIHVGTAQGRTMLFRYIHRLLDRQRDLPLQRDIPT